MSDSVSSMKTYLLTQSGVTDLVVARIYYSDLPQNVILPALALELTQSEIIRHLSATTTLRRDTVNVYCYAGTYTAAAALGAAVETALEFATGTWGAMAVSRCLVEGTVDVTEPPRDASEAWRWVRGIMAVVWHT